MAYNKSQQALIVLLFSLFSICSSIKSSETTGGVAIYWGQNLNEGDLSTTCDTGHYEIVLLAFLINFGGGRTPAWNFAGHCDNGALKKCTELEPEIKHCQANGIKVFLSIGGGEGTHYSLSSPDDAKNVANYLYDNFLSGNYGPLGSVTLDGIDFDIEKTENYWENLAYELDALRQPKKFYLSAAPQCPTDPIYYLGKAIKTKVFDYIFIQFYNNPGCSYVAGIPALIDSWNKWISLVAPNNTVFMGLPAAPSAGNGHISPDELIKEVLPRIKEASNYGGVMLWDRYRDLPDDSSYSSKILPYVKKSVLQYVTTVSDAIFEGVSAALHRIFPKSS